MPDQHAAATEHAILQEITAPLDSLPDDPLAAIDADFPMALRGYDRDAVDGYVRDTRRLVAELQATRSPEAAVRRALERVGQQISGILQRAHETAEQITAQSRSEAEDRLEQARIEARQIIDAADQRVRELDADTDRIWLERQRIVADAEDLSAQLLAVARTAAQRFPEDDDVDGVAAGYDEPDPEPESESKPEPAAPALTGDEPVGDPRGEPPAADPSGEATVALPVPPPAPAPPPPAPAPPVPAPARAPAAAQPPAPPAPDDTGPTSERRPGSEDETTAIIPPASQAANRRAQT